MFTRYLAVSLLLAGTLPLSLAACDTSPQPVDCAQPTQTVAADVMRLEARVTVAQGQASVRVSLGGADETTMGLVRLSADQTLALYEPLAGASTVGEIDETTAVALTAPEGTCGVDAYEAQVPKGDFAPAGMVLRLTESQGDATYDARRSLEGGGATPHDTPSEVVVGQPFDLPLDHDLPTIVGANWSQEWDLELRGDCLVPAAEDAYPLGPKDFAYAVDEDQVGSDQRGTTDAKAHFRVPAEVLADGSTGCEVSATFVVTTMSDAGGAAVTIPGTTMVRVEAAPFTFQLRPALQ